MIQSGKAITAIEVKSGRIKGFDGMDAYHSKHKNAKSIVVSSAEAPLEAFLQGEIPLF